MASVTDAIPERRISNLQANSVGTDSADPGPSSAVSVDTSRCAPRTSMVTAYNPLDGIQGLTQLQVKALMLQIGFALTGGNYTSIDSYNQLGKYLINSFHLVTKFYLKEDYFETYGNQGTNAAIHQNISWSGKNSIYSLADYFTAVDTQESVMYQLLADYYEELTKLGAIKSGDKPATIMGMLFVAHMSSPVIAAQWRSTGIGNSIDGTKLGTYYGLGRYAGVVLSTPTGIV